MGDRTCSVDGCGKKVVARGWCTLHYQRWQKVGGPAPKSCHELSPWERFWPKVDADGDCWIWTAGLTSDGYGRFRDSRTSRMLAHRWSYEALVGPIPAGLQLDHLCKNEPCVNPDHLEPVLPIENVRRSFTGEGVWRKTHCLQGHPYDEANTYISPNRPNHRRCRTCSRGRERVRKRECV